LEGEQRSWRDQKDVVFWGGKDGQLKHRYCRNNETVDENFSISKKLAFLQIIKHFRKSRIKLANIALISDLVKILSQ
jgi:hypothetical protein